MIKILVASALLVVLFPIIIWAQLYLWRECLMPALPILREPTFWQMVGINVLFGGIFGWRK